MEVKGYNGSIEVLDDKIIIKRKGIFSFISHGLKGNKEIYIDKISAIQIKNPGFITNGYIQFSFLGGFENKKGILSAVSDENTVIFTTKQEENFLKLKEIIENKRKEYK